MRARRRKYGSENKQKEAASSAARRLKNRAAILERERVARAENPDRFRKYRRTHYVKNRDGVLARGRKYKAENREDVNAKSAAYWRAHPELNRFHRANRRAAEKRATPSWADQSKIMVFYEQAVRLTEQTGIPHHVDHIYPLRSEIMCGLHVEANLQILPGAINQSKKNRIAISDNDAPRCCAWPNMQSVDLSSALVQ